MEARELKLLIQRFLHLVFDDPSTEQDRLRPLAALLDELSLAYFRVCDGAAVGTLDAPRQDYQSTRAVVAKRFPEFGLYPCVEPRFESDGGFPEVLTGDAVDDLADIAIDLMEVLWLWDNDSEGDAISKYKCLYWMHFGRHIQDLRSHLHCLLWE